LGLSGAIGGPILFGGISVDAFISPNVNINVNLIPVFPLLYGVGGGINYHFKKKITHWSPYIGLEAGYLQWYFWASTTKYSNLYVPLGINYFGDKGLNFAVEIGLIRGTSVDQNGNYRNNFTLPILEIKLGYRFLKGV